MIDLKEKTCEPCTEGTPAMEAGKINAFRQNLSKDWQVIEDKTLYKKFPFENFKQSMAFVDNVAALANEQNHHPDICISFSEVEIRLSTHTVGGLSENDFIMAAKIDNI